MRISAKGEYAIKAMLDLALHQQGGLQPIQDIAARQGIPQRYLEQVLLQIKRAGLLTSKRGSAGGYQLGRPANEITVGAVLRAVEGAVTGSGTPEVGGRGTRNDQSGDLAELWRDMAEAVSGVIDRMTFEDLRRRVEERREVARPMYHI